MRTGISFDRSAWPPTDLPFAARSLGRIRGKPYHSTLGTYHEDAMLTVVLSGLGRYLRNRRSVLVAGGMIGLVLPGPDVGVLMAEPSNPYDHLYCRFAGTEALRIARRVVAQHSEDSYAWFRHPAWEGMTTTMLHAVDKQPLSSWTAPLERMRWVDAVFAEVLSLLEDQPGDPSTRLSADGLLAYMNDHLASPTSLSAMADHFGVSKPHLCRVARRELGQTVQKVWEKLKLDRARILLADPNLTVREVAKRVGYDDPAYFSNVFTRAIGSRPTAYRKATQAPPPI